MGETTKKLTKREKDIRDLTRPYNNRSYAKHRVDRELSQIRRQLDRLQAFIENKVEW